MLTEEGMPQWRGFLHPLCKWAQYLAVWTVVTCYSKWILIIEFICVHRMNCYT